MVNQNSILSLLIKRFGEVKYTSHDDEVRFCCPFCQRIKTPDTKFHLYINLTNLVGFCFRCNYVLSPKEIKQLINLSEDIYYFSLQSQRKVSNKLDEVPEFVPLESISWSFLIEKYGDKYPVFESENIEYSLERFCREYGLCYVPSFQSIMIPFFWFGELVGFQFRKVINVEPKYLTFAYKDHNISSYIFNFDKFFREEEIYIVEGFFDGLPFAFKGLPWICIFGKNLSKDRKRLLSNLRAKQINIVLDGDAYKEAINLGHELNILFGFTKEIIIYKLPENQDPAELGLQVFSCSKEKILF